MLDGRGLTLGWRRLIDPYLRDGRLVQVTSASVTPEDHYVLMIREHARDDRRVRAFRDWILAEAKQDWS